MCDLSLHLTGGNFISKSSLVDVLADILAIICCCLILDWSTTVTFYLKLSDFHQLHLVSPGTSKSRSLLVYKISLAKEQASLHTTNGTFSNDDVRCLFSLPMWTEISRDSYGRGMLLQVYLLFLFGFGTSKCMSSSSISTS